MDVRIIGLSCAIAAVCTLATQAAERLVPSEYPTIQAAIDAAEVGDTVIVGRGVYTGDGNRDVTFHGKAITVRSSHGPDTCIIDCDGTQADPHRGFTFDSGETREATVEGFTICNGSTPPGAIADVFNGAGILVTNGSSPTIRGCKISGNWAGCWGGAICASFESHPAIVDCELTGNYTDDDGGGIFAWSNSHPVVVNTLIAGNESRVTGGGVTSFSGMTLVNCTVVGNSGPVGSGVYGWNATIVNSVIWSNVGDVQIQGSPLVTYSLVQGGYAGQGNLAGDPLFVEAGAGNFRLAAGSPVINAGDPLFVPDLSDTDLDGNPRVVCRRVDLGAYEYRGAGSAIGPSNDPCDHPKRPGLGQ